MPPQNLALFPLALYNFIKTLINQGYRDPLHAGEGPYISYTNQISLTPHIAMENLIALKCPKIIAIAGLTRRSRSKA